MAKNLSLHELMNKITEVITLKDSIQKELNHSAYSFFRKIIIYKERKLAEETKEFGVLAQKIRDSITSLGNQIPEVVKSLNADSEISAKSKADHKSRLLSSKGFDELLGLLEAIAIELTRGESFLSNAEEQNELVKFVDSVKEISRETRDFILLLQKGVDSLPPAALYTIEGHLIGVALVLVFSFVVTFNMSFIRLTQEKYEGIIGLDDENDIKQKILDLLLPLFAIPAYISLHYISTRTNLKKSFIVSLVTLAIGNFFYYMAYELQTYTSIEGFWFYIIGKAIIVSRLPLYGVKQFIGYHVEHNERVKLATCYVAAYFLGLSCGYILSLGFLDYEGRFLTFHTVSENFGGLLFTGLWVMIICFCGILFVDPVVKHRSVPHPNKLIQVLTIISYILPYIVLQAFVSNHAVPRTLNWSNERFFTFLGIFCLMAVPIHLFVYISSAFTTDKTLITNSKILIILASLIQLCRYFSETNAEFFYIIGSMLIVIGVNIGLGANFTMLAGNILNHRIGVFAGVLEVVGIVIGNLGVEFPSAKVYTQSGVIGLVLITLSLDLLKYKDFNPIGRQNSIAEIDKKDN